MPNVSDLFNFSNLSDRKQFTIVVVGIALYFGYRDYKMSEQSDNVVIQWKELYNTKSKECDDIRLKYDARLEKNIEDKEKERIFKDSINLFMKQIRDKK